MFKDWTNDLEFQLLENYKNEPIIWDAKHPLHKERAATNEAWQRISNIMNIPVPDLKKKRSSLLSSYRKYRQIIKDSILSAREGGEVYKPIWFAYDYMHSFLGDGKSVPKKRVNSITKVLLPESTPDESEDQPDNQECETYTIYDLKRERSPTPPRTKRRRTDSQELEEARSYIRQAVDTLNLALNSPPQEDDCDLYGRLLAGRLRRMPVQARWQFMHEVDGMYLRHQATSSQSHARHVFRSPSTNSFPEDTPDSVDT